MKQIGQRDGIYESTYRSTKGVISNLKRVVQIIYYTNLNEYEIRIEPDNTGSMLILRSELMDSSVGYLKGATLDGNRYLEVVYNHDKTEAELTITDIVSGVIINYN